MINRNLIFGVFLIVIGCTNEKKIVNDEKKTKSALLKSNSDTVQFHNESNHIVLNSVIEGKVKARLIYDTGAGGNLYFDSTFTAKNNWFKAEADSTQKVIKKLDFETEVKERNSLRERKLAIKLGNVQDSLDYTSVMNIQKIIKDRADGIIGNSFMSKYLVEIDYVNENLVLHKLGKFTDHAKYITIPMQYDKKSLFIYVNVDYQLDNGKNFIHSAIVDLGVGGDQIVIASNNIISKFDLKNQMQNVSVDTTGSQLLNYRYNKKYLGSIKAIKIGNVALIHRPNVKLFTKEDTKRKNPIGYMLIGNYIFKKFGRIVIDYQNNKIYIPKEIVKYEL